ncbi:MAG: hypothetical protein GWM90_08175 [Gemmatimonadetes bacterium]|nr:hypothetical protein [Gemmatimonadota bacterium]NIQ53852.1 hypothetical protein [Gemmatimonadota bacterium]NIX44088.1 hypothetical protein [Gemmatimonadota bacterium]
MTLALPVGAAHEAAEEAGVIQLAARAVLDALAPGLDSLGARTSLRCGRGATGFTLLAPPATWRAATSMLTDGLSEPVADSTALAWPAHADAWSGRPGWTTATPHGRSGWSPARLCSVRRTPGHDPLAGCRRPSS